MPPGRMVNLLQNSRVSQIAILVSVGVTLFALGSFFDSYAILDFVDQICHEIKGIIAFSFLASILRNTLRFEGSRMPLTV